MKHNLNVVGFKFSFSFISFIFQSIEIMFEALSKNLWTLITLILPGIFTYGCWRLLLLLNGTVISADAFHSIDASSTVTWSVIIAIAILQQSLGILVEFIFFLGVNRKKESLSYKLFVQRFILAATSDKMKGYPSSVIGNFFFSLNVFIGVVLLITYFLLYEEIGSKSWILTMLLLALIVLFFNILFRYRIAKNVVAEIE